MREIIISEDFFKSKQLGVCSAGARLLYQGFAMAEEGGHVCQSAAEIWSTMFPYDRDLESINSMLYELIDNQLIVPCKDCNGNTIYKFNDYRY